MKTLKILLCLLILLGFLFTGCEKDPPMEKIYYITGGFVKTDGFILPGINASNCDEPCPGPHLLEYASLDGSQPAKQTEYVYDMNYVLDFYCQETDDDEITIYDGFAVGSKKMALSVLFDEAGNYYITSQLHEHAVEEITYELVVNATRDGGTLPLFCSIEPGMLHMGFADYEIDENPAPLARGRISNWGADEIILSGTDTLYYPWENDLADNRRVISEWRIELEAR